MQNLGLVVNTLTPDHRYSILSRDSVTIPIQIQLSRKQKKFSQSFAAFLKSRLNFKCFGEKDDAHVFCTSDITDSENVVR